MVGLGGSGPKPASTDKDRAVMETSSAKGSAGGSGFQPGLGLCVLPIARKKNASLQLEYVLKGNKVVVALPQ